MFFAGKPFVWVLYGFCMGFVRVLYGFLFHGFLKVNPVFGWTPLFSVSNRLKTRFFVCNLYFLRFLEYRVQRTKEHDSFESGLQKQHS